MAAKSSEAARTTLACRPDMHGLDRADPAGRARLLASCPTCAKGPTMQLYEAILKLVRARTAAKRQPIQIRQKRLRFESLEERQVMSTVPIASAPLPTKPFTFVDSTTT